MAYQNSVYRSGSEPHRGGASEIPEPPTAHRSVPSYAARGRHMSDSALAVHRAKQNPSQQKYKAELRVLPEDAAGPQVKPTNETVNINRRVTLTNINHKFILITSRIRSMYGKVDLFTVSCQKRGIVLSIRIKQKMEGVSGWV